MEQAKLKYNNKPYSDDEIETMISIFQKKGYVILPEVFERDSVKEFKKELEEIMYFNGNAYTIPEDSPHYLAALLAPRGRQILPYSLSHSSIKLKPSLHTSIFVIETDDMRGQYAPGWHKDREPEGMPGQDYHYPHDVFLAYYFEDIDEEHGPTQIIPGSHRDIKLKPNSDTPPESIHLKMEDALLIDQRAWHRGIPRKAPGTRFVIVYGLYALPHLYGATFQMPAIQLHHWIHAEKFEDRVFFGGVFAPPTQETIERLQEEYKQSDVLQNITFPKQS